MRVESVVLSEAKRLAPPVHVATADNVPLLFDMFDYGDLNKVTRVTAWCLRVPIGRPGASKDRCQLLK